MVLYDFICGKSPFRSATEFLTFQKVLKRDLEFPEGFDPRARSLIEICLDLEAARRPTPQEIKGHPFFAGVQWGDIWSAPAPKIKTGMTPPTKTLAQITLDSDVWAAFDDGDSESDGDHSQEPHYNRYAAASAVAAVDHPDDELDPPRPGWLEEEMGPRPPRQPKARGWSTSSSSSGGRLSGLLDTIGINPTFAVRTSSGRVSRASDRDTFDDRSSSRSRTTSPEATKFRGVTLTDNSRW